MLKVEPRRSEKAADPKVVTAVERGVLSGIILAEAVPPAVSSLLKSKMFLHQANGVLFDLMKSLTDQHRVVDPLTIAAALNGQLADVGGMEYVAGLIDEVPKSTNIEHHAQFVFRYWRQRELARLGLVLGDPAITDEQVAEVVAEVQKLQHSPGADGGLRCYSDREILSLAGVVWIVEGLLPSAALVEIVGRYSSGKTALLLDLAMHIEAGLAWQGRRVQQGHVLYVYGEGAMKARVAAWRVAHRVPDEDTVGVRFIPGIVNLLDQQAVADFITAVNAERFGPRPVWIIFETLTRMTPGGRENDPENGSAILKACGDIQRQVGATVALSHHTPWDADRQRPRGHTSLPDGADAIFLLENDSGQLKLSCQKMREAEPPECIHLKLTPVDGSVVIDRTEPPEPDHSDMDELLAALGDGECTVAKLKDQLDASRRTVMRRLKQAGDRIEKVPGTGIGRSPAKYRCRVAVSQRHSLERESGGTATTNGAVSLARQNENGTATDDDDDRVPF